MSDPAIFICAHLDEPAQALLRAHLPAGSYAFGRKQDFADARHPSVDQFRACEICFGNVPGAWLRYAPRLRWLQLESIGLEYYQGVTDLPAGLTVTNLKGLFDSPAAETALAGLLALYRGIDSLVLAQADRRWSSLEVRPQMQLLRGKRAVILGHGSIGRKLRQLLEAFPCQVQSFARSAPGAELRTAAELDHALPGADIVACCLPNTAATRGLFDRRRIGLLAPQALFVNIGRGAVVDEPALVESLQQRRIGGAVLDVTWEEPLPAAHPLWTCPHTLLLQHTGGGYADELLDKARIFLANFTRLRNGQPLHHVADVARGY